MTLNVTHHEEILIKILKALFEDVYIAPYLAFKGGTAAMFFYQLDRFSVDLDFDLLDASKEEVVFNGVLEILKKNGTIKSNDNKRFGFTFILAYEGKVDQAQNLKVEISKRVFGSRYEIKEFMGIPMKVMVREDMVANKLMAMYERMGKANRDIYDVWFFLHHAWPINTNMITSRTDMAFDEFLKASIKALEQLDNKNILQGLGELLSAKQKSWAKAKLKTETLFLLSLKARSAQKASVS
jgi:predicted nucleotidyltransferase component of viral defense system